MLLSQENRSVYDIVMNDREIEHLVTMSLFYQIAIGFIPLSFIHPIDPVVKSVCS